MSLKRTTVVLVSAAALAAWFAGAMTPGRPPVSPVTTASPPIDASGAALASEIARLRERLRPDPRPREPNRNPFRFRAASPSAPADRLPPPADTPMPSAPAVPAEAPTLRLAGVAEDPGPDGTMRTAVITARGQLFLAKERDTVTDRGVSYRVERIFAESVELTDARDGTILRLTLK